MDRKRIIVEVFPEQYRELLDRARERDMTLANLVRESLGLPLERQGVKAAAPTKGTRKRVKG
jgi:hypothetical protein